MVFENNLTIGTRFRLGRRTSTVWKSFYVIYVTGSSLSVKERIPYDLSVRSVDCGRFNKTILEVAPKPFKLKLDRVCKEWEF